jgi:hypothetical protein
MTSAESRVYPAAFAAATRLSTRAFSGSVLSGGSRDERDMRSAAESSIDQSVRIWRTGEVEIALRAV